MSKSEEELELIQTTEIVTKSRVDFRGYRWAISSVGGVRLLANVKNDFNTYGAMKADVKVARVALRNCLLKTDIGAPFLYVLLKKSRKGTVTIWTNIGVSDSMDKLSNMIPKTKKSYYKINTIDVV